MALAAGVATVGHAGHRLANEAQENPVGAAVAGYASATVIHDCVFPAFRDGITCAINAAIFPVKAPVDEIRKKQFKKNIHKIISQYEQHCLNEDIHHNAHVCPMDEVKVKKQIESNFADVYRNRIMKIATKSSHRLTYDPFILAKHEYMRMRQSSAHYATNTELKLWSPVNRYMCHLFDLLSVWFRLQNPKPLYAKSIVEFSFETADDCNSLVGMQDQKEYHFVTDASFLRNGFKLKAIDHNGVSLMDEECQRLKLVWWRFMDKFNDLETQRAPKGVMDAWMLHALGWKQQGCAEKHKVNIQKAFAKADCNDIKDIAHTNNLNQIVLLVNKKEAGWLEKEPITGQCADKLMQMWGLYRQRMNELIYQTINQINGVTDVDVLNDNFDLFHQNVKPEEEGQNEHDCDHCELTNIQIIKPMGRKSSASVYDANYMHEFNDNEGYSMDSIARNKDDLVIIYAAFIGFVVCAICFLSGAGFGIWYAFFSRKKRKYNKLEVHINDDQEIV